MRNTQQPMRAKHQKIHQRFRIHMCSFVIFNFMFRSSASVFNLFLTIPSVFFRCVLSFFDCVVFCLRAFWLCKTPFRSFTVSCFCFGFCVFQNFGCFKFCVGVSRLVCAHFWLNALSRNRFLSSSSCLVLFSVALRLWLFLSRIPCSFSVVTVKVCFDKTLLQCCNLQKN